MGGWYEHSFCCLRCTFTFVAFSPPLSFRSPYSSILSPGCLSVCPSLLPAHARDPSVNAFCIGSYILGIGDRHLDNFLLDKCDGSLVGIDFGLAFGNGLGLPAPELIPFRLTQQVCRSVCLPFVSQSVSLSVGLCVCLSVGRSFVCRMPSVGWSVSQSVVVCLSVCQSVSLSDDLSWVGRLVGRSVGWAGPAGERDEIKWVGVQSPARRVSFTRKSCFAFRPSGRPTPNHTHPHARAQQHSSWASTPLTASACSSWAWCTPCARCPAPRTRC